MSTTFRTLSKIGAFFMCLFMGLFNVSGFKTAEFEYEMREVNPMKGFMPFYSEEGAEETVPYSMEWFYIPLSELMTDSGDYCIKEGLEPYLEKISSRNHQAVFRVYLDYPASELKDKAVPAFIWDMGVKKIPYDMYGGGVSPDFSDERLINILSDFIKELARLYDGDERIAYITTGLLGHWGEWHFSACPEAEPTDEQKTEIINAFSESFKKTRILTRYPGTPGTDNGSMGFHDDSFTFETMNSKESWYFYNRLKKAKQEKLWKTQPIGGEFRPEGQSDFLAGKKTDGYQDYYDCVKKTHCSWLMMQGAFSGDCSEEEALRAKKASAALGYDFFVKKASLKNKNGKTVISAAIKNVGNAPIYTDPDIIFTNGKTEVKAEGARLCELLPGETGIFSAELDVSSGDSVFVRVSSLGDSVLPVRFSNKGGNETEDGALLIGEMKN